MAASMQEALPSIMIAKIRSVWKVQELKPHQVDALESIVLQKRDCIICVPTGSGKSLCYETLTTAYCCHRDHGDYEQSAQTAIVETSTATPLVLVISPLVSLMNSQADHLNSTGIGAVSLGEQTGGFQQLFEDSNVRYVFGNPEHFLENKEISQVLRKQSVRDRVIALVFDEVHTAVAWGLSAEGKGAFRQFFSRVGDLRACFPAAPLLCLTATASDQTLAKIKELLGLKDPIIHRQSPDRSNIRLCVAKVKKGPQCLDWLLDLLQEEEPMACPKTIVYCRRYRDCSDIYRYFDEVIGPNPVQLHRRQFDMVHAKTKQQVKEHVVSALMDPSSKLRIVIATKVVGMGLDVACQQVVNYGPPQTVDDYLQQIGRAGRDGSQSHAVLLYSGNQLRNVEASMQKVLKEKDMCIRALALEDFGKSTDFNLVKHLCCNVCEALCDCGKCDTDHNAYEKYVQIGNQEEDKEPVSFERHVSPEQLKDLRLLLTELKESLDKDVLKSRSLYVNPDLIHGLSTAIVQDIIGQCAIIFSLDDILEKCPVVDFSTACKIAEVFTEVFADMDSNFDHISDEVLLEK